MSGTATVLTVVLLFAIVFPAIWLGVTTLIAKVGGWSRLERDFPDRPNATTLKRFRFSNGHLGHPLFGASYSGILTFEVCEAGLRIRVWKLFGWFSNPLFLPWDRFRTERYQWFIWDACRIYWGPETRDSMIIYRRLAERLALASDGRFGSPDQGR
ncbi:MAG: hypothetical protein AAF687_11230 [Pseudomonadota bacterium]